MAKWKMTDRKFVLAWWPKIIEHGQREGDRKIDHLAGIKAIDLADRLINRFKRQALYSALEIMCVLVIIISQSAVILSVRSLVCTKFVRLSSCTLLVLLPAVITNYNNSFSTVVSWIAFATQVIPPMPTHFFVAWSVCLLSRSCIVLKPLCRFAWHLAGTVWL